MMNENFNEWARSKSYHGRGDACGMGTEYNYGRSGDLYMLGPNANGMDGYGYGIGSGYANDSAMSMGCGYARGRGRAECTGG